MNNEQNMRRANRKQNVYRTNNEQNVHGTNREQNEHGTNKEQNMGGTNKEQKIHRMDKEQKTNETGNSKSDTIKQKIRYVFNKIEDIIYPRRCPVCDEILRFNRGKICAKCYHELSYVQEPRCKKCGRSIEKFEQEYCYDCSRKKHLFVSGIALMTNTGAGRKSVYAIKYRNKREYADFYTDEIVRRYSKEIRYWKPDILVPVPLHKKKRLKRGYNQAEVIAVLIGRKMNIEVERKSLRRIVNTRPQKELNDLERKKNLANAFKADSQNIRGRNVVVVDDIYTTGSTVDECAKVLLEAGAKNVHFITLSIGAGA